MAGGLFQVHLDANVARRDHCPGNTITRERYESVTELMGRATSTF